VLARLIEREHEAHAALGDAASLIGTYDVKAEEDAIRRVLDGSAELDTVVKSVDEVKQSGGLDAFFADLATSKADTIAGTPAEPSPLATARQRTGVYASEFEFVADAVTEFFPTPTRRPPNGIDWQVHQQYSIAALTPPADLRQRLQVLPQSYLRDRKVTETFKLALTPARGKEEIEAARSGTSTTTWPEAHFLAPLHPIVEWAADRALAALSRDEIFAVHGALDFPTVLVVVTQSNQRGQVVADSYYTVMFPDPAADTGLVTAHAKPSDAVEALHLATVNPGGLTDPETLAGLQPLVGAAVRAAEAAADQHAEAIRRDTAQRITEWVERTEAWKQQAGTLTQRHGLRERTRVIDNEQSLAHEMNPDRRLVRPLIVVIPQHGNR
jgi:hypothetical protein